MFNFKLKLFKGRLNRKNFFGGLLFIGFIFGFLTAGLGFLKTRTEENIYKSSSIMTDYMKQEVSKLKIDKGAVTNNSKEINKEDLNKLFLETESKTKYFIYIQVLISTLTCLLITSLIFRRFHDFNKPGYIAFLWPFVYYFSPMIIINLIIILFLFIKNGDTSVNNYGEIDNEKDLIKLFI